MIKKFLIILFFLAAGIFIVPRPIHACCYYCGATCCIPEFCNYECCTSYSCAGGSGYSKYCGSASVYCPCGCTPTCGGGSCNACPTSPPAPTNTPVPTIPMGTCTGHTDCKVFGGGSCYTNSNCTGAQDPPGNYSKYQTRCGGPPDYPIPCTTEYQCTYDTSCNSTPPGNCPPDRSGCTWYPANDCGGGVCTSSQRRTAYLWCGNNHCDDACADDATCNAGVTETPIPPSGPTNTPIPTATPTPIVWCPSIVSASPSSVEKGVATDFSITFSHPLGADHIKKTWFGMTNQCSSNTGEAYCGNFERQLANSLALSYDVSGYGTVGTNGSPASCSGYDAGGTCAGTYFSGNSPNLQNAQGTATVNTVYYVNNGNYTTYTWNAILHSDFPSGTYNYYAMVNDISANFQNCLGGKWDRLSTVTVVNPTDTPTPTPTNTPTPTATPTPGPWKKLKDTSFYSNNNLTSNIPLHPDPFDSNDTNDPYFITGDGGLVAASDIDLGHGHANALDQSVLYSPGFPSFTPSAFLSYVKARKEYTEIKDHDITKINSDGIYLYDGNLTLNNAGLSQIAASKFVLIVDGDVTIDQDEFNIGNNCIDTTSSKSFAILSTTTHTIYFSNTTKCAAGIFIANTIDPGTTSNLGLKIVGNLIAQSTFINNTRRGANLNAPSLFIVFKPQQYLDLLPYLSIANYDWRQIQ